MEELRKAIGVLINPGAAYSAEAKMQMQAYCDSVIEQRKRDFQFFFSLLASSPDLHVRFWAIGGIETVVEKYYGEYETVLKQQLHQYYFLLLETQGKLVLESGPIESKYAQLFTLLLRADYPHAWPDAFSKLLSLLNLEACARDNGEKIGFVRFILNVLIIFDREVIEYYEAKKQEECERSIIIKDEMRKSVVNDIAFLLRQILDNSSYFIECKAGNVVEKGLIVVEQMVDWANLELFLGNLPMILSLLGHANLQIQCAKCIYAMVDKGMDPAMKIALLENLNMISILQSMEPSRKRFEEDFLESIAKIVNKIGEFYLECLTKCPTLDAGARGVVEGKFAAVLSLVFKYLDQDYPSVSLQVTEFLKRYLALLKHIPMQPLHMESLQTLLRIVITRVEYPKWYTFEKVSSNTLEESFVSLRNELTTLFTNIASIPSIQSGIIEYVGQLIETLHGSYSGLTTQQKEVALFLFYKLGEAIKDLPGYMKTEGSPLCRIMERILLIAGIFDDHFLVVNAVLENAVRYAAYFEKHEDKCMMLLNIFLSPKGIFSSQGTIASKASHEFFRFFDRLKHKPCLVGIYPKVLDLLRPVIQHTLEGKTRMGAEDVMNLYQIVGIVVSYRPTGTAVRNSTLTEYFTMLSSYLGSAPGNPKLSDLAVKSLLLLLRSCEAELEPELKPVLGKFAEFSLGVLRAHDKDPLIREAVLMLFHKLVILMGVDACAATRECFSLISGQCDAPSLSSLVKIANIIVHSWKQRSLPLVKEVFGYLMAKVMEAGIPANQISDIEKSQVELIYNFLKLVKSLISCEVVFLFDLHIEQYSVLLEYVCKFATNNALDEALKKHSVTQVGLILAGGLGLSLASENLLHVVNQAPNKSSRVLLTLPEYAMHARMLMQKVEQVGFDCIKHLNAGSANQLQLLGDISALHFLQFRIHPGEFVRRLDEWCMLNGGINSALLKEKLATCEKNPNALKEYKEVLKAVVQSFHTAK